jgi:hypothetical protein
LCLETVKIFLDCIIVPRNCQYETWQLSDIFGLHHCAWKLSDIFWIASLCLETVKVKHGNCQIFLDFIIVPGNC